MTIREQYKMADQIVRKYVRAKITKNQYCEAMLNNNIPVYVEIKAWYGKDELLRMIEFLDYLRRIRE